MTRQFFALLMLVALLGGALARAVRDRWNYYLVAPAIERALAHPGREFCADVEPPGRAAATVCLRRIAD